MRRRMNESSAPVQYKHGPKMIGFLQGV